VIPPSPGLSTAAVCDAAAKTLGRATMKERIIPGPWAVSSAGPVIAPAYTVRITYTGTTGGTGVADWLDAFDNAPEGAFTIVTAGNPIDTAVVGDAAGRRVKALGGAGMVVVGIARDVSGFFDVGLPLWTHGTGFVPTPISECTVEYEIPMTCGGVEIAPGDTIVADGAGVLALGSAESDEILEAAAEIETAEEQLAAHLAGGGLLREGYERTGTA
jgi:4-hydroxy-4-methyl-2-oxoglutarate aldolase